MLWEHAVLVQIQIGRPRISSKYAQMVELVDTLVLEASLRVRVRVSLWAPIISSKISVPQNPSKVHGLDC